MGVCNCSMFCCTLLYVHSSIAIILMGKRELIALLNLSSWCLMMVERLFLAVPRGSLQFVIVVFPDHTHYFCQYRFYFVLRFDYDDPQFRQNVEDVDALFNYLSFTMPENFLPILEYLPGSKVMKKISFIVFQGQIFSIWNDSEH